MQGMGKSGETERGSEEDKGERRVIRSHTKLHSTPYMVTIVAPAAIVSREAPRYTIQQFGLHDLTVGLAPFRISLAKLALSFIRCGRVYKRGPSEHRTTEPLSPGWLSGMTLSGRMRYFLEGFPCSMEGISYPVQASKSRCHPVRAFAP